MTMQNISSLDLNSLIGCRIREERRLHNLTQQQMAHIFGISPAHYSNIENGNRTCSLELLIRICRHFSISSDRLLRDFLPLSSTAASDVIEMLNHLDEAERAVFYNLLKSYQLTKLNRP